MKVAVVGATGMVGQVILELLEKRAFPVTQMIPVASAASVGRSIKFKDQDVAVVSINQALNERPDLALFSAGSTASEHWAPKFAEQGTYVIDNSSFWRMSAGIKLIVPEINGDLLGVEDRIIANPNCSTIQMVLALGSLHKAFKMKRVIVSTYQSVSGTGQKAVQQLENEIAGITGPMAYPYPIHKNALPHCDVFLENGYTKEEQKLATEPQKILGDSNFSVSATAVRIPTAGGHSESVNVSFERDFDIDQVRQMLNEAPGVVVQDLPQTNTYPMPFTAHGKDEVFVGRLRRDPTAPNSLNLWIVADNLRKGAATNAVQIAETLLQKGIL